VEPNVLIIFDSSLSMAEEDVVGDPYDPATTYAGTYSTNAVYEYNAGSRWGWSTPSWDLFVSDVEDLNCTSMKNDLVTQGWAEGRISNSNYTCGRYYSSRSLRLGNYLNYDAAGGGTQSRISVAKSVITNLINTTDNVRFGLMRFNAVHGTECQGGYIVSECGTDKSTLVSEIANLTADGYTPLAETLAEAGLYFAGEHSWFNGTGGTYSSGCENGTMPCKDYDTPMEYRCQKNYIILMTDGEPTYDRSSKLTQSGAYINGGTIGDYDHDGNDPGGYALFGSDYLDDVAKYLYENDLNPSMGSAGDFEMQNVVTYTIGFQTDQQLLRDTAANGGGEYFTANNISTLSEAFERIISAINETSTVFVAPVVPVSRMNEVYAGNYLYAGFFSPQQGGRWIGNLKKYGLDTNGDLVDADGIDATFESGAIKDTARSFWSQTADGQDVAAGGAGGVLQNQGSRNLYTYMETQASLTHADNAFSADNALITDTVLGVSGDTQRETVINDVYGTAGSWILGDILHSEPTVVHYDTDGDGDLDATYIFMGANDGMLHCINDSDGSEAWGFIPPDQLGRLNLLSNDQHTYFVDGAPTVYEGSSQKILLIGERRGGNHYYALDITSPTSPSWLYKIVTSGASWSKPVIGKIKTSADAWDEVFFLTGGYDENQDQDTPDPTDTVGRSVFAVRAGDGSVSSFSFDSDSLADMTHCIVDLSAFDTDGDGFEDTVYAGDLGGNMFAFEDKNKDGTWSGRKLFQALVEGGIRKKIFYAPDGTREKSGERIFFGTGDRAHPGRTDIQNRMYCVKNEWEDEGTFTTLTEDDLVDVTDDLLQLGTLEEKETERENLFSNPDYKGWYIRLENPGEKVVSTPVVFGGVLYFTTYTPPTGGVNPDDPCGQTTATGVSRLYAVDYLTGASVHNYSSVTETDGDGNTVEMGKLDRVAYEGGGMASSPVIAVLESGPKIYLGVERGIAKGDAVAATDLNIYYWRQMF
jgi:type IV pilus assembly protein PilY1